MPSSHLILCHPLLLLPLILPSIRASSNESTLHMRWPKYWRFSFSISPSNEQPRLVSFRMDWLALLAVQETLKSLLQHHSSKASVLRHSAFFTVQLSQLASSYSNYSIQFTRDYKYNYKLGGGLVAKSCPTLCDPMDCSLHRLLYLWDFPGKNAGVGCHFLLQGTILNQGLNLRLLYCRWILYWQSL